MNNHANKSEYIMHRYEGNPLITVDNFPVPAQAVFNCGQTMYNGKTVLLIAAHYQGTNDKDRWRTGIHVAMSDDGIHFDINPEPLCSKRNWAEGWPENFDCWVIDPRVTKIGDTYYIVRPAQVPLVGPAAILEKTKDFKSVEFVDCIALPSNRVPCLFPEKIGDYYVRLDRPYNLHEREDADAIPEEDTIRAGIWVSYSPDLIFWGKHRPLIYPNAIPKYANWKMGPTPPIKTKDGWLVIIHGVMLENKEFCYSIGAMLLDLNNPEKIIGLLENCILTPTEPYEREGRVNNVVFPCGAIADEETDTIRIYYGAADTCIGLAEGKLSELLDELKKSKQRYWEPNRMTEKEDIILKKAERILRANCYPPNRYKWGKYRMISPSKGYFLGIWNWDSAFHAIGMIDFDIEIAKEQIEGFLQFQKADGLLPDVIWEDGRIVDAYSKPPVMAYAAFKVYEACQDTEFLKEVYPKLVLNEKFWSEKRFHNGMFHYDADRSDGCDDKQYNLRVGYETGWDNSPRWDAGPQNLWPVDLNCFMVMTYRSLSEMAKALNLDYEEWLDKEKRLTANIEKYLWNERLNAYTDYDFVKNTSSDVLSPASFMPLFIEISSKERARDMDIIARKHFLPGMPTVAYDNPEYSTHYWRGPCWINTAYFAAKGLKNYGFNETAETVKNTVLEWLYKDGDTFHENYNSKTGEGQNNPDFSWSCVFARKFIKNI